MSLALAQQALAIDHITTDRLRLGIGTRYRPLVDGIYGLSQTKLVFECVL
jgi:alkanesulfonate monooxygenase SsuD/methylene tetrahydromethanopterin reductase-like flavin-dependent oxidoreductase (luciferase family)